MQVQRFSLPNFTLSPCCLSPTFSSTHQLTTKLCVFNLSSTSGFFKSLKRVSKLPTGLINHGGLVRIRCGVVEDDNEHGFYVRRCVEIARRAIGCTSPNPLVGCVIVKDGKIVGEGFHPKAGQPHAEVFALRDAGNLAENATAYVSLEPCNHYGRTPPCTEALINAKVKRVVVGMVDPNPIVASKGVDRLKDAGIEVTVGVEQELCKMLNEFYIHKMLTGKPFVTLRYSLSINGHIVDQLGEGAEEPGGYYSQLLQEYDAVILSSASINDKLPFPASQEPGANQPLWIIAARNHGSSINISRLAIETAGKLIIFTDKEMVEDPEMAQKGIETVVLGEFNLNAILEYCSRQGFCSVLIDSRGKVEAIEEFFEEDVERNLLQKVVVEILPLWVESDNGNLPVALKGLGRRLEMKKMQTKISGKSVVVEGYI